MIKILLKKQIFLVNGQNGLPVLKSVILAIKQELKHV